MTNPVDLIKSALDFATAITNLFTAALNTWNDVQNRTNIQDRQQVAGIYQNVLTTANGLKDTVTSECNRIVREIRRNPAAKNVLRDPVFPRLRAAEATLLNLLHSLDALINKGVSPTDPEQLQCRQAIRDAEAAIQSCRARLTALS